MRTEMRLRVEYVGADMCAGMRLRVERVLACAKDMCVDMCIEMCIDMCIGVCASVSPDC